MKKAIRIFLLLVFVSLFFGTMYFIYNKSKKVDVIYELHKPFHTNIIKKIVATGTIVPEKEVDIKPKVSGLLSKVYVEAGDLIKKGQIIAKITIVPDMVSLNESESRVRKAQIKYDNTKMEYDRNKPLYDSSIVSDEEFQQLKLNFKNAQEELVAAKDNVLLIKKGVTNGTKNQTNTLVRSTIDGMVLDIPFKEGSSVIESNTFNDGTTVAQVADVTKMIFKGVVDESDVNKLKLGLPIRLTIGAIEGFVFNANIIFIAPKGKEDQGAIQFDIKAAVSLQKEAFIRVGYSANADIIIEEQKNVLSINEGLLQFDDKGAYVEVEKDVKQEFEKIHLKTGLSDGINIQVLSGIDSTAKIKQWDVETTYDN